MKMWCRSATIFLASALIAEPLTLKAEEYPARPVKIIVQTAAGSAPDVIARVIADHLSASWRQQVVIVNNPGAGGGIAARAAASAPADGYTLFMPAASAFVLLPITQPDLPLDMQRDFVPIGFVGEQPMIIAVSPALGVSSLRELIALGKQRPSPLLYAANNRGSLPHLAGELFRSRTGIAADFVPYPGASQALHDIAGGRISLIIEGLPGISGAISGGLLMPLGVASAGRLSDLPNIPTVAETVPAFEATGWFALVAPSGTPDGIVQKVARTLNAALMSPELEQRYRTLGTYVRAMSPAQLSEYIRAEQRKWRSLAQQITPR